jgi:hypothetical protein
MSPVQAFNMLSVTFAGTGLTVTKSALNTF